jgi:hypothetical protein
MVLKVPPYQRLQPLYGIRERAVHSLSQRRFNFFQLDCHALAHGLSVDHEVAGPLVRATDVGKT